ADALTWQDPIPAPDYPLINSRDVRRLKAAVLKSGLTHAQLVRAAWSSASTFRDTDMRGGANGARIRLAPQMGWEANSPAELKMVLSNLEGIRSDFNTRTKRKISMADLIVLAGAAAIEDAADKAGVEIEVPFSPGRGDASAEQTDAGSFAVLEPKADGFRNYLADGVDPKYVADLLVDKADTLSLTVPEMTALVGGLRALDANVGGAKHGVFTDTPGTLTNDFFVNLLSMDTKWAPADGQSGVYEGRDRATGKVKWTATGADLIFGSNSQLRAVAETYAYEGAQTAFVQDFVKAWSKVMNLDRFDGTAASTANFGR
ncbi:MAG: peroxidase family protein, partial [Pseudomonadota bacterium]